MSEEQPGARGYIPRVYRVSGRHDIVDFVRGALSRSGAQVIYESSPARAPFVFSFAVEGDERIVVVVYAFRCNPPPIKGRAPDEHRVQVRYGSEPSWVEEHPLAQDVAGADVTLVLGVHIDAGLLIGLDPLLYDPLPMGISIEFKDADVAEAQRRSWHVWERDNVSGVRRAAPRASDRLETLVAFTPQRLIDYVRFEREASMLSLDPPLRHGAARALQQQRPDRSATIHQLEEEFELSAQEILEIVVERHRLGVALRGGVAEHHLARVLDASDAIEHVVALDEDGRHDFDLEVAGRRRPIRVECKNCSPQAYADGTLKVEVQKTRASKNDPASRFYAVDQFDIVAACKWPATGTWDFVYKATADMALHDAFPDRLAAIQRVDDSWSPDLASVISALSTR